MDSTNISVSTAKHETSNVTSACANDADKWEKPLFFLLTIGPIFLIVVGTIGNTIAYLVLKRKSYKKNIMASSLRYLAVIDTTILWTFVLKIFIEGMFGYDIAGASYQACALFSFYALASTSMDSWLLVIITATRLIHIKFPFTEHSICSKTHYYIALVLMHVGIIAAHGGVQYAIYDKMPNEGSLDRKCVMVIADIERDNMHFMAITTAVNFIGPCSLLIIFTVLIMRSLKTVDQRKSYFHPPSLQNKNVSACCDVHNSINDDAAQNALSNAENIFSHTWLLPYENQYETVHLKNQLCERQHTAIMQTSTPQSFLPWNDNWERKLHHSHDNCKTDIVKVTFKPTIQSRTSMVTQNLNTSSRSKSAIYNKNNNTKRESQNEDKNPVAVAGISHDGTHLDGGQEIPFESQTTDERALFGGASVQQDRKLHTTFADGLIEEDENKQRQFKVEQTSRIAGLTRLLVAACMIYFCLNIPFWVFYTFFSEALGGKDVGCFYRKFVIQSTLLVQSSNHSVNFFFYGLTCPRFREELSDMLRGRKVSKKSIAVY